MKITTKSIDTTFENPSLDTKRRSNWVVRAHFPYYADGYFLTYKGVPFFVRKSRNGWLLHDKWTGVQISGGAYNTRKECVLMELQFIESQGGIPEFEKRTANFEKLN